MWLGIAFGIGCVVLFAHNAQWDEIGPVLTGANLPLIALAAACLLTTSVARAWRWRYLLPAVPVSFRHRLTSTLIGFAGNNTLPGRLGEPLRCWVISRLDRRVSFWQAAGSIVVERVFDLAAAVVLLLVFLVHAPLSAEAVARNAAFFARLQAEVEIVVFVLVVAVVGLMWFARRRVLFARRRVLFPRRRLEGSEGWVQRGLARLAALQQGFTSLRSIRAVAMSALFTLVLWTAMLFFELAMLRAFGFNELGLAHALGLLVVLSFAIALPQAPAGVGVVQLASETTLTALYGMPIARAKAFAIGLWVCQVSVVVGAGAVALWLEGLSFNEIRRARGSIEALRVRTAPE